MAQRREMELIDISAWEDRPVQRRRSREEFLNRRRKRRRQRRLARALAAFCLLSLSAAVGVAGFCLFSFLRDRLEGWETGMLWEGAAPENISEKPEIVEEFLTPNPYSRPGERLPEVNNIFIHYTANQGTSARQNRSYFENLGLTGETSASAHFVIGFEGEIIQCLPLDEIGYAVKSRNYDSISIECCYLSPDGEFTSQTYESLLALTGWLLKEYRLSPSDVLRHYDEGGKLCPLYYVEHQEAWERLLRDLEDYIGA